MLDYGDDVNEKLDRNNVIVHDLTDFVTYPNITELIPGPNKPVVNRIAEILIHKDSMLLILMMDSKKEDDESNIVFFFDQVPEDCVVLLQSRFAKLSEQYNRKVCLVIRKYNEECIQDECEDDMPSLLPGQLNKMYVEWGKRLMPFREFHNKPILLDSIRSCWCLEQSMQDSMKWDDLSMMTDLADRIDAVVKRQNQTTSYPSTVARKLRGGSGKCVDDVLLSIFHSEHVSRSNFVDGPSETVHGQIQ